MQNLSCQFPESQKNPAVRFLLLNKFAGLILQQKYHIKYLSIEYKEETYVEHMIEKHWENLPTKEDDDVWKMMEEISRKGKESEWKKQRVRRWKEVVTLFSSPRNSSSFSSWRWNARRICGEMKIGRLPRAFDDQPKKWSSNTRGKAIFGRIRISSD